MDRTAGEGSFRYWQTGDLFLPVRRITRGILRMEYYIRRMREEDIPQVVEIEKAAFSRPWSRSIFKATLLLPYAAYYVAVEEDGEKAGFLPEPVDGQADGVDFLPGPADGQADGVDSLPEPVEGQPGGGKFPSETIIGLCGVKKIFEEGEISNVAVHPDHRGRGISRKMLETLMEEAQADGVKAFTLEVRAGNQIAIRLYESLGFRTEGIRPRFYDHPVEDGFIMWKRPAGDGKA